MKAFRVSGTFRMGQIRHQPFTKEILAKNKKEAEEKALSIMGSRHKNKRTSIKIKKIEEMKPEDVTDYVLKGIIKQK